MAEVDKQPQKPSASVDDEHEEGSRQRARSKLYEWLFGSGVVIVAAGAAYGVSQQINGIEIKRLTKELETTVELNNKGVTYGEFIEKLSKVSNEIADQIATREAIDKLTLTIKEKDDQLKQQNYKLTELQQQNKNLTDRVAQLEGILYEETEPAREFDVKEGTAALIREPGLRLGVVRVVGAVVTVNLGELRDQMISVGQQLLAQYDGQKCTIVLTNISRDCCPYTLNFNMACDRKN